jgi:hypothetical protein
MSLSCPKCRSAIPLPRDISVMRVDHAACGFEIELYQLHTMAPSSSAPSAVANPVAPDFILGGNEARAKIEETFGKKRKYEDLASQFDRIVVPMFDEAELLAVQIQNIRRTCDRSNHVCFWGK